MFRLKLYPCCSSFSFLAMAAVANANADYHARVLEDLNVIRGHAIFADVLTDQPLSMAEAGLAGTKAGSFPLINRVSLQRT